MLDWKHSGYVAPPVPYKISQLGLTKQEMIGLFFFRHIRTQVVVNDFSSIISIDGPHRTSKSTTTAMIACLLDETFEERMEQRIVVTPDQFMKCLTGFQKDNLHGGCIQVDEAGVTVAGSDYYERWMKCIVGAVQVFGWLNPFVFFVAPIKDFVNAPIRKMFHYYFTMKRYGKDCSYILPHKLNYSSIRQKTFYPKPTIMLDNKYYIKRIKIPKPPQWLVDRYRAIEERNKPIMLNDLAKGIELAKMKDVTQTRDDQAILNHVVENFQLYLARRSRPELIRLNTDRIAYKHSIPPKVAAVIAEDAEKLLNKKQDEIRKAIQGEQADFIADSEDKKQVI